MAAPPKKNYSYDFKLKVVDYYLRHGGDTTYGLKSRVAQHFNMDKKTVSRLLLNPELVRKASRRIKAKRVDANSKPPPKPPPLLTQSKTGDGLVNSGSKSSTGSKQAVPHGPKQPLTVPNAKSSNQFKEPQVDIIDLPEDPDFSLLKRTIPTMANGPAAFAKLLLTGASEVKQALNSECELILECKVCRNLFRSVINFLAHKRVYCRDQYKFIKSLFDKNDTGGLTAQSKTVIVNQAPAPQGFPKSSESQKERAIDLLAERLAANKKTKVDVNSSSTDSASSHYYDRLSTVDSLRTKDSRDCSVVLRNIPSNQVAVFQTYVPPGGEIPSAEEVSSSSSSDDGKPVAEILRRENLEKNPTPTKKDIKTMPCDDCPEMFSSKRALATHRFEVHGERIISPCPLCKAEFMSIWGCMRHLGKNHKKKKHQRDRLKHVILAKQVKKIVSQKKIREGIEEEGRENDEEEVVDSISQSERESRKRVLEHEDEPNVEKKIKDEYIASTQEDVADDGIKRRKSLTLPVCNSSDRGKPEKRISIQIRKDYKKSVPSDIISPVKHEPVSPVESIGGNEFVSLESIQERLHEVGDFDAIYCKLCKIHYKSSTNLKRHIARHLQWTRFQCSICGYGHFNKYLCEEHFMATHKDCKVTIIEQNRTGDLVRDLNDLESPTKYNLTDIKLETDLNSTVDLNEGTRNIRVKDVAKMLEKEVKESKKHFKETNEGNLSMLKDSKKHLKVVKEANPSVLNYDSGKNKDIENDLKDSPKVISIIENNNLTSNKCSREERLLARTSPKINVKIKGSEELILEIPSNVTDDKIKEVKKDSTKRKVSEELILEISSNIMTEKIKAVKKDPGNTKKKDSKELNLETPSNMTNDKIKEVKKDEVCIIKEVNKSDQSPQLTVKRNTRRMSMMGCEISEIEITDREVAMLTNSKEFKSLISSRGSSNFDYSGPENFIIDQCKSSSLKIKNENSIGFRGFPKNTRVTSPLGEYMEHHIKRPTFTRHSMENIDSNVNPNRSHGAGKCEKSVSLNQFTDDGSRQRVDDKKYCTYNGAVESKSVEVVKLDIKGGELEIRSPKKLKKFDVESRTENSVDSVSDKSVDSKDYFLGKNLRRICIGRNSTDGQENNKIAMVATTGLKSNENNEGSRRSSLGRFIKYTSPRSLSPIKFINEESPCESNTLVKNKVNRLVSANDCLDALNDTGNSVYRTNKFSEDNEVSFEDKSGTEESKMFPIMEKVINSGRNSERIMARRKISIPSVDSVGKLSPKQSNADTWVNSLDTKPDFSTANSTLVCSKTDSLENSSPTSLSKDKSVNILKRIDSNSSTNVTNVNSSNQFLDTDSNSKDSLSTNNKNNAEINNSANVDLSNNLLKIDANEQSKEAINSASPIPMMNFRPQRSRKLILREDFIYNNNKEGVNSSSGSTNSPSSSDSESVLINRLNTRSKNIKNDFK